MDERLIFAAIAAATGLLLGWLLTALSYRSRLAELERARALVEQERDLLDERASALEQARVEAEGARQSLERKLAAMEVELESACRRVEERSEQIARAGEEQARAVRRIEALQDECRRLQAEAEGHKARAEALSGNFARATERQKELEEALAEVRKAREAAERQVRELQTRIEEQQKQNVEARRQLEESKQALKEEFRNLANEIFESKGRTFSALSQQQLGDLLKPFREQVEAFRKRVEEIHGTESQQRARLVAELDHLKELNRQMTEEAQQLANALKGQKKSQGNWGELILENVLDRSGLQAGRDYKREVSFNTEEGRKRPDVVIYLPQNRHLVIDAKVSLNAYTRYINAEDEAGRQQALREHVRAVSDRISELSDRSYFEIRELNSPEIVIMFIPVESAFVEALRAEPQLFERALQQNVLVATPTTLLTSLNIVRQLWRFEQQNKHSAELAERAARVHDKLRSFLSSMTDLGKRLESAGDSYRKAMNQLTDGRGNLVKQVAEFRELGVAVKKELPEEVVERATLELPTAEGKEADQVRG